MENGENNEQTYNDYTADKNGYLEDNSYNFENEQIQDYNDEQMSNGNNPNNGFMGGHKQNFRGSHDNLARGINKVGPYKNIGNNVNNSSPDKKTNNNQDNGVNNKRNLAQGVGNPNSKKDNNQQDNKNKMPRVNNDNKKNAKNGNPREKQNKNNGNSNDKKNIFNRKKNNVLPQVGKSKNKDGSVADKTKDAVKDGIKQGVKALWAVIPLPVKILVPVVGGVFIFALAIVAIATGTATGVAIGASMCNASSYGTDIGLDANVSSFICGMQDPLDGNYTVASLYGWRDYDPSHMHAGIDLAGDTGTSVKAVHDGKVVYAGFTGEGSYGNLIQIEHDDGINTFYGHLNSIDVEVNQEVKMGDVIGTRGNTGKSSGAHLHFEIRDGDNSTDTVSPNIYFGYSDKGYEECINRNGGFISGCDIEFTGSARFVGTEGKSQACGLTSSYSSNGNNSSCCGKTINTSNSSSSGGASIVDFIKTFEGTGGYCDSKTKTQYKAYQENLGNGRLDRVTIGFGVTSDDLPELDHAGQCIDVKKVDEAALKGIERKRTGLIQSTFVGANLTQYQEDAMTSMAYNGCGTFFGGIAAAAKRNDLEGVWNAMKGCYHSNGQALLGLQRRRKAEFALYVTGDYSIAEEYKSKNWTDAEYNDYDSDGVIAKKASGTSSSCPVTSNSGASIVEVAQRELEQWQDLSNTDKCNKVINYLEQCNLYGNKNSSGDVANYCAGFVSYVLKESGVFGEVFKGENVASCAADAFLSPTSQNTKFHENGSNYTPQPGDVLVKNRGGSDRATHVGIVEKVEGKTITTIEGNTGSMNLSCPTSVVGTVGQVVRKTYNIDDKYITGFVSTGSVTTSQVNSSNSQKVINSAIDWALRYAADNTYTYKSWKANDADTHKCPICHPGSGKGWNCIGFVSAAYYHGAGYTKLTCSNDGILTNNFANSLYGMSESNALSAWKKRNGNDWTLVAKSSSKISDSKLKPGDVVIYYSGSTYKHVAMYIGDYRGSGKSEVVEANSGKADSISVRDYNSANSITPKIVFRFTGTGKSTSTNNNSSVNSNSTASLTFINSLNSVSNYVKQNSNYTKYSSSQNTHKYSTAKSKIRQKQNVYMNCATPINWALQDSLNLADTSIYWNSSGNPTGTGWSSVKKYFTVYKYSNSTDRKNCLALGLTLKEAASKGYLKPGDIIGMKPSGKQHTFVYAKYENGHVYAYEGGGEAKKKGYATIGIGPFNYDSSYKSTKITGVLRWK